MFGGGGVIIYYIFAYRLHTAKFVLLFHRNKNLPHHFTLDNTNIQ